MTGTKQPTGPYFSLFVNASFPFWSCQGLPGLWFPLGLQRPRSLVPHQLLFLLPHSHRIIPSPLPPPPRLPACWKISYNWFIWDLHWLFVPLGKTWSRETERSHLTMSAEVLLTSGSRLKSFPYCFPHLPSKNSSPVSSSPPEEALLVQVSRA